jgi:hypothetical protein
MLFYSLEALTLKVFGSPQMFFQGQARVVRYTPARMRLSDYQSLRTICSWGLGV